VVTAAVAATTTKLDQEVRAAAIQHFVSLRIENYLTVRTSF
jgi:hypothetical protein